MGKRYLIDSNIIIDFCNGRLSSGGRNLMENIDPEISIITNIELFATKNISEQEHRLLERFVALSIVHPLNTDLVKATIDIRRISKIKLPDAVIAATAITYDLVLLSRNIADFKNIIELNRFDPHTL